MFYQVHLAMNGVQTLVAAIAETSHEIQIPSIEPQQKTYFQQANYFH
jgi:hypothetical protein